MTETKLRILIVEDDENIRETMKNIPAATHAKTKMCLVMIHLTLG